MHPLIRILCLLAFAILAPWLPATALSCVAAGLLTWGLLKPRAGRAMMAGLRRIRWLIVSVVVVYLWFSPGEPFLPAAGVLSPTVPGLVLAAQRVGVLLLIAAAAAGLLASTPVPELTAALRQLFNWPIPTRHGARFADRIGLLMAELPSVESRVSAVMSQRKGGAIESAAELIISVERSSREDGEPVLPRSPAPVPRSQLLLPAAIVLAGCLSVTLS